MALSPEELHIQTQAALAVTGAPEWGAVEDDAERDQLAYYPVVGTEEEAFWALVVVDYEEGGLEEGDLNEECFAVETTTAEELIKAHLRNWLLNRGWQLQVSMHNRRHRWRLVDCLSISDGGGDRLDDEYPYGDEELRVLCESVVAIAANTARPR